jgi:hypothetical protein
MKTIQLFSMSGTTTKMTGIALLLGIAVGACGDDSSSTGDGGTSDGTTTAASGGNGTGGSSDTTDAGGSTSATTSGGGACEQAFASPWVSPSHGIVTFEHADGSDLFSFWASDGYWNAGDMTMADDCSGFDFSTFCPHPYDDHYDMAFSDPDHIELDGGTTVLFKLPGCATEFTAYRACVGNGGCGNGCDDEVAAIMACIDDACTADPSVCD